MSCVYTLYYNNLIVYQFPHLQFIHVIIIVSCKAQNSPTQTFQFSCRIEQQQFKPSVASCPQIKLQQWTSHRHGQCFLLILDFGSKMEELMDAIASTLHVLLINKCFEGYDRRLAVRCLISAANVPF